jgi:hypothetical protein
MEEALRRIAGARLDPPFGQNLQNQLKFDRFVLHE